MKGSMPALAVEEEMRKKQEPKRDFFLIATPLVSGIPKIKDLNFGICLTVEGDRVKTFASSH